MENYLLYIIGGSICTYLLLINVIAKIKKCPSYEIEKRIKESFPAAIGWLIVKLLYGILFLIYLAAGLFILFSLVKFIKWAWFI